MIVAPDFFTIAIVFESKTRQKPFFQYKMSTLDLFQKYLSVS